VTPQPGRLRIGDAEREQAASDLNEHYAEGRLTADEHAERLDAIWTARTRADLAPIFADLPPRSYPAPDHPSQDGPWRARPWPARPSPAGGRRHGLPFLPVVAALVLLSILTHLPWILIFFVGCWVVGRGMHRAPR
jgi:hypothetical protein